MALDARMIAGPGAPSREPLTWSLAATVLCAVVAGILDQSRGLLSVAAAASLVLAYFISGMLAERIAMQRTDGSGMLIVMASYALRVGALGVALWWSMSTPAVAERLNSTWVAVGGLTALATWLAGLVIGHARSRIPIYDRPYEAPEGWDQ